MSSLPQIFAPQTRSPNPSAGSATDRAPNKAASTSDNPRDNRFDDVMSKQRQVESNKDTPKGEEKRGMDSAGPSKSSRAANDTTEDAPIEKTAREDISDQAASSEAPLVVAGAADTPTNKATATASADTGAAAGDKADQAAGVIHAEDTATLTNAQKSQGAVNPQAETRSDMNVEAGPKTVKTETVKMAAGQTDAPVNPTVDESKPANMTGDTAQIRQGQNQQEQIRQGSETLQRVTAAADGGQGPTDMKVATPGKTAMAGPLGNAPTMDGTRATEGSARTVAATSGDQSDLRPQIDPETGDIRLTVKPSETSLSSFDGVAEIDMPIKMKTTLNGLNLSTDGASLPAPLSTALSPSPLIPLSGMTDRLAATILQTTQTNMPVTLDKLPQAVVAIALSSKTATLQIDPPELGRIQLDYQFDTQGRTVVTLTPESDAARTALMDRMSSITAALQQGTDTAIDVKLGDARDFGAMFEQSGQDSDTSGSGTEGLSDDLTGTTQSLATPLMIGPAPDGSERLHIRV
jgi:hypothetical protein